MATVTGTQPAPTTDQADLSDADQADQALAAYLAAIGVDLPLMPVFFDGAHSANVFGCAECATIHMPCWDGQTLYADRYVPMTDRAGCDGCEDLPVEHDLAPNS